MDKLVFLGGAGTGKTTICRYITPRSWRLSKLDSPFNAEILERGEPIVFEDVRKKDFGRFGGYLVHMSEKSVVTMTRKYANNIKVQRPPLIVTTQDEKVADMLKSKGFFVIKLETPK